MGVAVADEVTPGGIGNVLRRKLTDDTCWNFIDGPRPGKSFVGFLEMVINEIQAEGPDEPSESSVIAIAFL